MAISGISSMESYMASLATGMQGGRIQQEIGYSVLKQVLDTQEMQGQMLVKMMENTPGPSLDGTGSIVNIAA